MGRQQGGFLAGLKGVGEVEGREAGGTGGQLATA